MLNKWRSKADALIRLAEDQRGKPEGDLAREKLVQILNKHPEAFYYEPLRELAKRDFTLADLGKMTKMGVSTDGSWTGRNLSEAIRLMVADYEGRLDRWGRQLPG